MHKSYASVGIQKQRRIFRLTLYSQRALGVNCSEFVGGFAKIRSLITGLCSNQCEACLVSFVRHLVVFTGFQLLAVLEPVSDKRSQLKQVFSQTYIMYPDAVRPIYFLLDREDSQAYHLKWRKLRSIHLCRSVDVNTQRISRLIAKQTDFNWGKFSMFRIISPKLLELFHTRTI